MNLKEKWRNVNEYKLTASVLDRRIKQAKHSGSFSERDNRIPKEKKNIVVANSKTS